MLKSFPGNYDAVLDAIVSRGSVERDLDGDTYMRAFRGGFSLDVDLSDNRAPIVDGLDTGVGSAATDISIYLVYHAGRLIKILNRLKKIRLSRSMTSNTQDLGRVGERGAYPTSFILNLIEHRLQASLTLRVSDVFKHLPHDIACHAFLLDSLAASLGCRLANMHVTVAYGYVQEASRPDVLRYLVHDRSTDVPLMPGWGVSQIISEPRRYVETAIANSERGDR